MVKSILHPSGKDWRHYKKQGLGVRDSGPGNSAAPGLQAAIPNPQPLIPRPWWDPKVPGWLVVVAIWLAIALPIGAQMQQSGGSGSNASVGNYNAAAPTQATLSGGMYNSTLPTLGNGQMGTEQLDSSARQIVVGAGTAGTASGGVVTVQGISGATAIPVTGTFYQGTQPVSGTVNTVPLTACGNTVESQALEAIPTTSTAVFTSTTCLMVVVVNNTNSSAASITVSDNEGTPINDVLTFSIPAYSQLVQPLWGLQFTTGVKWTASTTGLTGGMLGYH